jgi:hypothetical protein
MASRLKEICVTVDCETQRWGDSDPYTVVLRGHLADDPDVEVSLKGPTDGEHPQQHLTYLFYGSQTLYRGNPQFKFQTFVHRQPHSRSGIITYLAKAPGIGSQLARRLWDLYKSDAVRMLRTEPEAVAEACERLGLVKAIDASQWLEHEVALENCTIDLVGLLEGHGIPKTVVKAAVKEWGNLAAAIIRQNPYRLMQFRGVGFKKSDALYLALDKDPARLKRQALCAWYHVASNSEGDTWYYKQQVVVGISGAIGGSKAKPERAIELANRAGILSTVRTDGVSGGMDWDGDAAWMADGRKARNELLLADYIVEALCEK